MILSYCASDIYVFSIIIPTYWANDVHVFSIIILTYCANDVDARMFSINIFTYCANDVYAMRSTGTADEKARLMFNVYDVRRRGVLTRDDFTKMIKSVIS